MKLAAAVLAFVAVATGCRANFVRSSSDPTPTPAARRTATAGPASPASSPAGGSSPATSPGGTLELQLFDDDGGTPTGVVVEIDGRSYESDARGRIAFSAEPGTYSARVVAGCHRDVFVHGGGTARFGLVANRTTTGRLRAQWQHRYGPAPPVERNNVGHWKVGERVEITYTVMDHCSDERANDASFGWFAFHTSANVEIVGHPVLRSDGEGKAQVSAACAAPGPIGLVMRDADDPSATFALDENLADFGGTPRCR